MSDLTVSVVIPTYNRAHLIGRALRSVLPECRHGDEVIVVDDGSVDDTEAVVRGFGPPVRYLRGEHRGPGAARNAGFRAAAGDLVAVLDSDDEWIEGKLSWQRAVMRQFDQILFLFSDFGVVRPSGERVPHYLVQWHGDMRTWDDILGPGVESAAIVGLPTSAPPFRLHMGRLYEGLIDHFYVFTGSLLVRREAAGDALRCAEDLPRQADQECFARLAARGLAGYMDCDTAWQYGHEGARLTDLDPAVTADCLIKITERVWGEDEEYLKLHRAEFEAAMDMRRLPKVRYLLATGRRREAREELNRCFRRPWPYVLVSNLPGGMVSRAAAARRLLTLPASGRV